MTAAFLFLADQFRTFLSAWEGVYAWRLCRFIACIAVLSRAKSLSVFSEIKIDGFVKSRHSGENRSPETL
jgi:hypothetical protein